MKRCWADPSARRNGLYIAALCSCRLGSCNLRPTSGPEGRKLFHFGHTGVLQEKQLMARGQLKGFSGFDLLMAMKSGRPDHALKWMMARVNDRHGIDVGRDRSGHGR